MNLKRLGNSFQDAWKGIVFVFRNEQNFRIQIFVSFLVFLLVWYFPLSKGELIVIILLVFFVLILELLNSAVERLADVLKPRLSYQIKIVKDIMAAIVFITTIASVIIGGIIFWPYLVALFV
ncbi:MAG TPA: diacylglycerol kinase [Candidatus Magasanikbacteria bacterium]|jgi:diacylglycerol kinase|nr:diacylglycerol kinase [Candidatus Magasanikbacteria bacterium]HQF56893.1 diacylglycerol kinase [Candidatus Magasanikbacteria bacterium]HQL52988.1 diacylglycerol kinase [Candidatus Magasanikbacteria bacterium]